MAILSVCASLTQGADNSCTTSVVRKYYQQIVLINKNDINKATIVKTIDATNHKVVFSLLTGKTGYLIKGSESGSAFSGMYEKSTNETLGLPQYAHKVNYIGVGLSQLTKSLLDKLDRGSFVVACQATDNTVEIYGLENGMTNADYTYDIQGGNGGSALVLSSMENAPESVLPLTFASIDPNASFDTLFA